MDPPQPPVIIRTSDPTIPYVEAIPGGVFPGKAITVRGSVLLGGQKFCIDLCCGLLVQGDHQDNKALHVNPRFIKKRGLFGSADEDIVLNSLINNKWGAEERFKNVISQTGTFTIRILVLKNYFKIAVNGKHLCDYVHRVRIEDINTIFIGGTTKIDVVEFEGMPPSDQQTAADQSIAEGFSTSADAIFRKPAVPFVHSFKAGLLVPGKTIFLTATPKMRAERFYLNILAGDNYFFHCRVDFDEDKEGPGIIRNSTAKVGGHWMNEEREISKFPFSPGITFDLKLELEQSFLKLSIDGNNVVNFKYRLEAVPLSVVNTIDVRGDIAIQRFELQ